MTNEELVQLIQDGRQELMPKLWDAVKKFVAQQAYKAAAKWDKVNQKTGLESYEDFFNTGYLAVCEAVQKYEPQRQTKFITVLGFYLKKYFNFLYADLSDWSYGTFNQVQLLNLANVDSLNKQKYNGNSDDNSYIEIIDTIADPNDSLGELDNKLYIQSLHNELEKMLNRITKENAEVIRLFFYENRKKTEIAKSHNISISDVNKRLERGLLELKSIAIREKSLNDYIDCIGLTAV